MAQFVSGVPTFFEILQCLRMPLFFSHDALCLWLVLIHGGVGALNAQNIGQYHLRAKLACQPAQKTYPELGAVAGKAVLRNSQFFDPVSDVTLFGFNQPTEYTRPPGVLLGFSQDCIQGYCFLFCFQVAFVAGFCLMGLFLFHCLGLQNVSKDAFGCSISWVPG